MVYKLKKKSQRPSQFKDNWVIGLDSVFAY